MKIPQTVVDFPVAGNAPVSNITALAVRSQEIVVSNNEQYVFYCDYLKTVTRAISDAEKIKTVLKEKIKAYRVGQEVERERREGEVLRLARVRAGANSMPQPATITNMLPEVEGLHYRTKLKWRVKNQNIIPREYMENAEKKINDAVKALGWATNIRGIEVYEDKTPVGRG